MIYDTGALLLKLDSRRLWKLAMSKNLRSGASTQGQYTHDQKADVWLPSLKNGGGFRFLHSSGRNSIVERCHRLLKVPNQWIRPVIMCGELPNDISGSLNEDRLLESTHALNVANIDGPSSSSVVVTSKIDSTRSGATMGSNAGNEPSSPPHSPVPVNSSTLPRHDSSGRLEQNDRRYFLRSHARSFYTRMHLNESAYLPNMDFRHWPLSEAQNTECLLNATLTNPTVSNAINPSDLFDEYGSFGLSRMPPEVFLQISDARQAIRDEIRGLLRKGKSGIPAGEVITSDHPDFSQLEKLHTTMVCKLKFKKALKPDCACAVTNNP